MEDQFRVWIKFANQTAQEEHLDTDWTDQFGISSALSRLLHGPAAKLNMISQIKIIDTSDSIVYMIKDGRQVWPVPQTA